MAIYTKTSLQESPELLEVKMSTDNETNSDVAGSRRRTIDTDDVSVSFSKLFQFLQFK